MEPCSKAGRLLRLLSMIGMLGVLGMLIYRASDPDVWRFLAPETENAAPAADQPVALVGQPDSSAPTQNAKPDGRVAAALRRAFPAAQPRQPPPLQSPRRKRPRPSWSPPDRPTWIPSRPTPCPKSVKRSPIARFISRRRRRRPTIASFNGCITSPWSCFANARKDILFDQFLANPEKQRFKIVLLDLNVRLVRRCDIKGPDGEVLHEVWGFSADSGDHLYDAVVIDLPKEMRVGERVFEKAKIVGYFFKLQGYEPAGARHNAPPLVAPLFVGRIIWQPPVIPAAQPSDWKWGALWVVGIIVLAGAVGYFLFQRGKPATMIRPVTISRNPDAPTLDEWLDGQEDSTESLQGNKFSGNSESNIGESNHTRAGDEEPPRFSGDFDSRSYMR